MPSSFCRRSSTTTPSAEARVQMTAKLLGDYSSGRLLGQSAPVGLVSLNILSFLLSFRLGFIAFFSIINQVSVELSDFLQRLGIFLKRSAVEGVYN
jgi:hypothetical protein